jgi:hypothetical protein
MDTGHNDPVPTPTANGEAYAQALPACQAALAAGRYAEAIVHAEAALRERPGDAAATACKTSGVGLQQQEQTYNTGLAQFARGELETAYFTVDGLPTGSIFRARPQFANIVQGYARMQLEAAHTMLDSDPTEAHRISQFVLNMQGISTQQRTQASAYERQARANTAHHPTETVVRHATNEPHPTKVRPTPTPTPEPPPQHETNDNGPDDLDAQTRACAMRGDNPCIIRLLEGRAHTQNQIAQLIEAYRARGQTSQAVRHMRTFVQRFPSTPRARSYQQILARQE